MRRFSFFMMGTVLVSLGLPAGVVAQDEPETEEESRQDSLSEAESALDRILQEALDEGVIRMKGDAAAPAENAIAPTQGNNAAAPEAPWTSGTKDALPTVPAYKDIGSLIEATAGETATDSKPSAIETSALASNCRDTDLFEFRDREYSWSTVSSLQSAISGGAGESGLEAHIRLAKHYLALGFAEEAINLLRSKGSEQRAQTVVFMGEAVAGRVGDANALKSPNSVCSRAASLWRAVVLIDSEPTTALFLAGSATDELSRLPSHLRADFGSRLGVLAAENGQWSLAETLYDIANTTPDLEMPSLIYLRALINAENGTHPDRAIRTIERFAQEPGPLQSKALLMLSQLRPDVEGEQYPGYFRDLENITAQSSGVPQTFPEAFMEVRLAAETGDYLQAVAIASRYNYPTEADQNTMRDTLAGMFESGLARHAASTRFAALNGYLANDSFFDGAPRETALREAAGRAAFDLGLPGRAARLLEAIPEEERSDATRRYLARAYLGDGRNNEAAAVAGTVDDDRMRLVEAMAYERMGRTGTALEVLARGAATWENLELQAVIAWRAADWRRARDAYAALLVAGSDPRVEAYYALASYMAGQRGDLMSLDGAVDFDLVERLIRTHTEEMTLLREVIDHG